LNLSKNGGPSSGKAAADQLLAVSGDRKPELIFISGELMESSAKPVRPGEPHHFQKPFRISDVLTLLLEIFSTDNTEKAPD
jgi:hypothetical protein